MFKCAYIFGCDETPYILYTTSPDALLINQWRYRCKTHCKPILDTSSVWITFNVG